MIEHIGYDFSNNHKLKLSLLPGIHIPFGLYQIDIQYISEINGGTIINHSSFITDHRDRFHVMVGREVRSVQCAIYRHNSFQSNTSFAVQYQFRIDELILLNLACKLIKFPRVGP